ncbi:Putative lipoprotein [Minicystis rosea]|nr:Putative lipoprotein [Minicystis rosea]
MASLAARAFAPAVAAAVLSASTPALAVPPMADPDPWLSRDKALHFGVSVGVAGTGYGLSALGTDDIRIRIAFGAGAGILVGAAKELIDLTGAGDPSWKDFAWDVVGTLVGVGIAVSIDLAVRSLRPKPAAAAR